MSDSTVQLGKIINSPQARDAVHVAVAPVTAGVRLRPSQRITVSPDGVAWPEENDSFSVGIVDPFLLGDVAEGERFWVMLKPNTITGMRHEWQHPAFPPKALVDYLSRKGKLQSE